MTISYAELYDPNCPWGYWMTPVANANGTIVYEDIDGTRWASIREAFWVGRLNMSGMFLADQILDRIAEVLAFVEMPARVRVSTELSLSNCTHEFYQLWLNSVQLAWHGKEPLPLVKLSDEGRAVLTMLRMTQARPLVRGWTPRLIHEHVLRTSPERIRGVLSGRGDASISVLTGI